MLWWVACVADESHFRGMGPFLFREDAERECNVEWCVNAHFYGHAEPPIPLMLFPSTFGEMSEEAKQFALQWWKENEIQDKQAKARRKGNASEQARTTGN